MAISADKLVVLKDELNETMELVDSCLKYTEEKLLCEQGIEEIQDHGLKYRRIPNCISCEDILTYYRTQKVSFSVLINSQSWAIKKALELMHDEIADE